MDHGPGRGPGRRVRPSNRPSGPWGSAEAVQWHRGRPEPRRIEAPWSQCRGPPSQGGTMIWAVHEGMPDFDIHYQGTYIAAQPIGPIYNGLLTFDVYDHEKVVGDLAERWEIAPDGTQITFALRQGVKFHDGADFTCADAKYSLEKLTDPRRATPLFVTIMEDVFASATCTDDYTLVLSLKEPSAVVLNLLAGAHAVMMKAGIAEQVDRKDSKFLIGTGPFKFKSHTPGIDFRAERNPNYWKPGLPHIDEYQAVVMADLTKIFASFRARQLTMTGIGRHLEPPEADILKKDFPDAVVALGPRAGWDTFAMNLSRPPFNDPRVRKAVALATDREKIIAIAAEGWGVPGGYIGPHTPYGLPLEVALRLTVVRSACNANGGPSRTLQRLIERWCS